MTTPVVVIRPSFWSSGYHSARSGPSTSSTSLPVFAVGVGKLVTVPFGVTRRILPVNDLTHMLPSAPSASPRIVAPMPSGYSVMIPDGVILAILPAGPSVNQTLPSLPAAM